MRYTTLGKTGLRVSVIGLGGIPIQRTDAAETKEVIKACLETGINYVDTARLYTVSEGYLGQALEGCRDMFILASKSMARDYKTMKEDVEKSLRDLRTDYIDVYQFHNIRSLEEFECCFGEDGAYRALEEARREGKIGHIGATMHAMDAFERMVREYSEKIETIMFPFNIVETQGAELIRECSRKNIGFIAMKPLAGGNLKDAGLALKYILDSPDGTIAIPGMGSAKEVYENAKAAEAGPLSEEERTLCLATAENMGTRFCRRCGYCAPCPQGIDITNCFLFANYLHNYGLADWAKERYSSMEATARDCVKCGACEMKCPYELPIRQMLEKVALDMGK